MKKVLTTLRQAAVVFPVVMIKLQIAIRIICPLSIEDLKSNIRSCFFNKFVSLLVS